MKKTISVLLVVALTLAMAPSAYALESATPTGKITQESLELKAQEAQETIELVEKYLVIDDNGFIENDMPKKVSKTIDAVLYKELAGLVNETNEKIADGDIVVTESLTVIDTNDDELVVQGGKVTKLVPYWWGYDFYMSKKLTNIVANALGSTSFASGGTAAAGAIAGAVVACTGGAAAPFIGLGVAIVGGGAWYCNAISSSLKSYNNSKGTILSVTKVLVYWVAKQK